MRRILVLFALLGLGGSLAVAAPLCLNDGTYAFYEANYSTFSSACLIGDKLFWGFTLGTGPNSVGGEPKDTQIQVQTLPGDGFSNPGISFNSGGWTADPGFPIDAILSYNVATQSGAPIIEDATLTITGTLTGTGASSNVKETLTPAVPGSPLQVFLPGTSQHITFLANEQSSFLVKNEINVFVDPAFPASNAHISVVENQFSEDILIPEPMVTVLIGSGLLLFGIVRRKRVER